MTFSADRRNELARKLLGGTRLATAVPVASDEAQVLPKSEGAATGPKVLVIEDDPTVSDLIVRALANGHVVYRAADGKSGLELLRRLKSVDVIICDVMMPHIDGFGVAKVVKADPELCSIPIVFLTARDTPMDHVAGIQAGARSYLTKPFKIRDLYAAVERACRNKPAP